VLIAVKVAVYTRKPESPTASTVAVVSVPFPVLRTVPEAPLVE
jgi:hypothetical protein